MIFAEPFFANELGFASRVETDLIVVQKSLNEGPKPTSSMEDSAVILNTENSLQDGAGPKYSQLSQEGHLYKMDACIIQTPQWILFVGPLTWSNYYTCLSVTELLLRQIPL